MWSVRYCCQILMKLELSWLIKKKNIQKLNFMKIRLVGENRQTDKHDEVNSRFWKLCDHA